MVKSVGVTICRPYHCHDQFTTWNRGLRNRDLFASISFGCHFNWTHKAYQFFNRRLDEGRLTSQLCQLVRMFQQGECAAANQVHSCFVTRHQQKNDHGQNFIFTQLIASVFCLNQCRDQIVFVVCTSLLDELLQLSQKDHDGGNDYQEISFVSPSNQGLAPT